MSLSLDSTSLSLDSSSHAIIVLLETLIAYQRELQNHTFTIDSKLAAFENELFTLKGLENDVADLKAAIAKREAEDAGIKQERQGLQAGLQAGSEACRFHQEEEPGEQRKLQDPNGLSLDLEPSSSGTNRHNEPQAVPDGQEGAAPITSFSQVGFGSRASIIQQRDKLHYTVEESIYGLMALPRLPLGFGLCFILVVFYTLTGGLVMIIYHSVVTNLENIRAELYADGGEEQPLCEKVSQGDSYTWVCSPRTLVHLMDFDRLDSDRDGLWSVAEARNSSLLYQFRAMNEIALEQHDMLASIFPSIPTIYDPFCVVMLTQGTSSAAAASSFLSEVDQVNMLATSGRLSEDLLSQCTASNATRNGSNFSKTLPMDRDSYKCLLENLCADIRTVPGSSSESQFYENTSFMAVMPRSLHELLRLKLLRPCRLVDPELCANAEHEQHSLLSDVWPSLPLDQAVQKCSEWITHECPRLIGEDFKAIQARLGESCGQREHKVFPKSTANEPVQTSESSQDIQCNDGSREDLAAVVQQIYEQLPAIEYVAWAVEVQYDVPRGTVTTFMDCTLGSLGFGFHRETLPVLDSEGKLTQVADIFGKVCPMSSCKRMPNGAVAHGCPVQCLGHADLANNVTDSRKVSFGAGDSTLMGNCIGFHTEADAASGSLRVRRLLDIIATQFEHCQIILQLNKTARIYVTSWNVPMRESAQGGDGLCMADYLMIDGKKHCSTDRPAAVDVQPRSGSFAAVIWEASAFAGEFDYNSKGYDKDSPMGFEMIIVDASVATKHPLVTISFEVHSWYWDSADGVTTPVFHAFLILIMLIWIGYLSSEWQNIFFYLKYILQAHKGAHVRQSLLVFFLVLPRFLVWCFVMYTGIILLATARSYVDLVLNSVALAFVLEFDEYLFAMTVPGSLKEAVRNLDVIEFEAHWILERLLDKLVFSASCALDVQLLVRMLIFITVSIIVVQGLYGVSLLGSPDFNTLSEVYDCLCGLRGTHCPAY